ncbi:MAG: cadherin-like beta sandwich domain-containing protein [Bacilli bacterium]|nr:cadherin-like beta sandwich domain-containing protein [Bacilli bacterium]
MKKTLQLGLGCLIAALAFFTSNIEKVDAASGTFSISAPSSVTVGSTFSVTVKASASKIFYWQFYVSYSSKLKLVSGSTTIQGEADDAVAGTSYVSRTYKFKALSTGSASVSVARGAADMNINTSAESISYSKVTKNISIVDAVAKSSNANLAAITPSIGTLTPAFNADTISYTVDVNTLIDSITLATTVADSTATVAGGGILAVTEGANNFNITVTAANGAIKTYNVIVNVIDSNPITVKIGKDSYTVIKKPGLLTIPTNYIQNNITIADLEVVAYTNETTKLTLVGLKDKDGNAALYVYDAKEKTYIKYNEIAGSAIKLHIFTPSSKIDIPKGYITKSLKIGDITVNAWQMKNNTSKDFYLVYGMNIETGKSSFYIYDSLEKSFQRYDEEKINSLLEKNNQYFIAIIAASALSLVFISITIFQLIKKKKIKK